MKTRVFIISVLFLSICSTVAAQPEGVSVAASTSLPDPSAMLDVQSTTKGILIPTMSHQQMEDIELATPPAHGLLVFVDDTDNDLDGFYFFDANASSGNGAWLPLGNGGGNLWVQNGNTIENTNGGPVVIDGNNQLNEIYFQGTIDDDQSFHGIHTAIVERVYEEASEKSELLLFKGNDEDNIAGPDRIRYDAVGYHVFQVGQGRRDYVPDNVEEGETVLTIYHDGRLIVGDDMSWPRMEIYKYDPLYNKPIGTIAIRNGDGTPGSRNYMLIGADANEINALTEDGNGANLHFNYENQGTVWIGGHADDKKSNLYVNGVVIADGFEDSSDRRLKTNIQGIPNPLDLVLRSRGVTYNRKGANSKKLEYGVIAQEVEKVIPDLVGEMEPDRKKAPNQETYKTVAVRGFIPIMIEAIKEQQKQIRAYEKEIGKQQQQIETLSRRLAAIEKSLNLKQLPEKGEKKN